VIYGDSGRTVDPGRIGLCHHCVTTPRVTTACVTAAGTQPRRRPSWRRPRLPAPTPSMSTVRWASPYSGFRLSRYPNVSCRSLADSANATCGRRRHPVGEAAHAVARLLLHTRPHGSCSAQAVCCLPEDGSQAAGRPEPQAASCADLWPPVPHRAGLPADGGRHAPVPELPRAVGDQPPGGDIDAEPDRGDPGEGRFDGSRLVAAPVCGAAAAGDKCAGEPAVAADVGADAGRGDAAGSPGSTPQMLR